VRSAGAPAAVGFSLGVDRGPVVSIVGDGAALYSPQALWTAAYEKLPVIFVVVNNREYNILKNFMKAQPTVPRCGPTASSPWILPSPPSTF
jgi:benzoylformate decarboxylase